MYQYTKRVLTCASVTQRLQAASKGFIFLNNSWGIIINLDSIWLHAKVEASTFPLKARRGLYLINDGIGVWGHWELLGKAYCKCELGRTRRWWHFWEARLLQDCPWGDGWGSWPLDLPGKRSGDLGLQGLQRSGLQREVRWETTISCQALEEGKWRPTLWSS